MVKTVLLSGTTKRCDDESTQCVRCQMARLFVRQWKNDEPLCPRFSRNSENCLNNYGTYPFVAANSEALQKLLSYAVKDGAELVQVGVDTARHFERGWCWRPDARRGTACLSRKLETSRGNYRRGNRGAISSTDIGRRRVFDRTL